MRRLEVDTSWFKGNFPESCSLESCNAPEVPLQTLEDPQFTGQTKDRLSSPDAQRLVEKALAEARKVREQSREAIKAGRRPGTTEPTKPVIRLEAAAREWHAIQVRRWKERASCRP